MPRWKQPPPVVKLKWAEPPPAARGPTAYDETVPDKLRARPGKWALIKTARYANTASAYAKSRRERWGPMFDVVCRGKDVYARFVHGPPNEEE
jgi:hypothetical protein